VLAAASPEERLKLLMTRESGLTVAEAADRLRSFGRNQPVRSAARHPARDFLDEFTHTLALLLWFAAGLSFAAGITELGAAILAVLVINGVFAFIQEYRAGQVVESLLRQVAVRAAVIREGVVQSLEAGIVVPGDVVQLTAGHVAPADCVLLSADGLSVDLSLLTGETLPVEREPSSFAVAEDAHIADVACLVPAGAGIVTGSAVAVVWTTGASSSLGHIAGLVASVQRGESLLERQVAGLSHTTAVIAVLAGGLLLFLATAVADTSFLSALTFATGVIVALVPEGLLPTLSVSLAIGTRRMARRGAAVRRLSAVETVGSTTVICTDKTGTLTENRLSVSELRLAGDDPALEREALLAAVLCNSTVVSGADLAGDPFDVALWRWAMSKGLDPKDAAREWERVDEVPFDAHRRYQSVTCQTRGSKRDFVKGAPEAVIALCEPGVLPDGLAEAVAAAAARGERVLLLASGATGEPLRPLGIVAFHDPPREGVSEAIAACGRAGIRISMLTGDHPETARAVASRIGLGARGLAVTEGPAINAMTDRELLRLLSVDAVIARVDPEQKLRIVQVLQRAGEVVLVTGDGINDAPALRAADVGVAMGLRGTEVAKQASDIVLADDNFATIVAAIEEGRSIKQNIRRFVSYVFTSNVAEMAPFLVYILLPVPLPLAVIQALAIDIGTDLIPALALGAEEPDEATISRPPEPPSRPLMTRELGLLTFLFFGVIEASLGLGAYFLYYFEHGWRPFDSLGPFDAIHDEAASLTFLAIVGGQLGCLVAQRSGPITRRLSFSSNPLVLIGVVFELVLAVVLVYTPGLNGLFSMEAVHIAWFAVVPAAAAIFILIDQGRRALLSGRGRPAVAAT
jgi:calcium-translocating P-type ATPase